MKILQENRRLHVQSGDTSLTKTGNAKAIKKITTNDFAIKQIDLYDQRNHKQSQ